MAYEGPIVPAVRGGTDNNSYAIGDILYADSSTTLTKLNIGGATTVLHGGTVPSYSKVGLTTDVSGILPSANGGTGINNGSSTITLGGNLTTSGAFGVTFTFTGTTSVTFPTSGTLATTAGSVSTITGTAHQITASASTGPVTLSVPQQFSIGTTSPDAGILGLQVTGTATTLNANRGYGILYNGTFSPTASSSATIQNFYNSGTINCANGNDIQIAQGQYIGLTLGTNTSGTITYGYGMYIDAITSTGSGSLLNTFGLLVVAPAAGSSRVCSLFQCNDLNGSAGNYNIAGFRGLMTGDDGANQIILTSDATMQPLADNKSVFGLYFVPFATPHSTNTITNAYGAYAQMTGSAASGAVSNAYSGYFAAPSVGSNRHSLHADDISIGASYVGTSKPPSNGMIVQGNVIIGNTSQIGTTAPLQVKATGYVFSASDATATLGLYVNSASSIQPTAIGSFSAHNFGIFTNNGGNVITVNNAQQGVCIGNTYASSAPPSQGLIVQGQVGIGTSSITSNRLVVTAAATDYYNTAINGTQTSTNGGTQIGILISNVFNPTSGAVGIAAGLYASPNFIAPSAQTMANAIGIYLTPQLGSNVGTITNAYGLYIESSGGTGTITNAYGALIKTPGYGSGIRVGTYINCVDSVGAAGTRYGLWVDGTLTGDDGTFTKGIYCPVSLRPTNNNMNCYGGWFAPNIQPNSTNTINNAVAIYAFANGSAGSGTISNGYSLYLDSPAIGTNRLGAFFNGADSDGTTPGTRYLVAMRGVITGDDGNNTIGLLNDARLQPTSNNKAVYGLYLTPNANPHSTQTISNATATFIQMTGTAASGTITFAQSVAINTPAVGTTRWGFSVTGADANGDSPGCQKMVIFNGTMTGDDGSTAYGIVNTPSMRPTTPNRNTIGLYSAPYADPHSTNTIPAHYAGYFVADGTVDAGAVTFGISLRALNPIVGTTKIALYADNIAIGTATQPPSSGIYCIGQSYFGNASVLGTVNSIGNQISYQSLNTGVDVGFGGTNSVGCLNLSVATLTANISTAAAFMAYPGLYVDGAHTVTNACGYFSKVYTGGNAGTITNLCGFYFSANGGTGTIVNNYGYYAEGPTSGSTLNANFYANGSSSSTCFYANISASKTGFYAKCPDTTTDAFFTQDGTNNGVAIRNTASQGITFYGYQNSITLLTIDNAGAVTVANALKADRLASNSTPSATSGTLRTAPGDLNGSPSFSISTSVGTWQNPNDYDVLVTAYATSSSGAVFSVGVGTTSSPTVHVASPSLGSGTSFFFSAFVPASYYVKISVGAGTLTIAGNWSAV